MEFTFLGFRETKVNYYGAKCSVCGNTFESGARCMYSPMKKEFRCFGCHQNHPENLCELWLVDKAERDEVTGKPVTVRTIIHTDTKGRETGAAQMRAYGITPVEMLESFPKGAKNILQVRREHMERLNLPQTTSA